MTKTALITGGSSGIGRALVVELIRRGVRVVASGRNEAALTALAEETGALSVPSDLSEAGAPDELYRRATAALGAPPDFLVNNAGYNSRKALVVETTNEELEAQYAVNLRAPLMLCRAALGDFGRRGSGHIVNVCSTVVHHGCEQMGLYSAMKHGLHGFTKVLVKEARPLGVKVTAVYPGGTDSNFRAAARPDYMRPESVAQLFADCLFAPDDVVIHELTFRPLVETNF